MNASILQLINHGKAHAINIYDFLRPSLLTI